MVDVSDLIGAPFVEGARGPDTFDCYGLVRELYLRSHDIRLPDFPSPHGLVPRECAGMFERERSHLLWVATERVAGSIVLLRVNSVASHVGFMLDPHTLCHTWRDAGGVCTEPIDHWDRRIVGFYRYAG